MEAFAAKAALFNFGQTVGQQKTDQIIILQQCNELNVLTALTAKQEGPLFSSKFWSANVSLL